MKKEMLEINVTTFEGMIKITQPYAYDDDDDVVVINPGQVDTLIKWLEEAKAEIEGKL